MSEANTQPLPEAARKALPFLIELGLAKRCEHCPHYRDYAKALSVRADGVSLTVDRVDLDIGEAKFTGGTVVGHVAVRCSHCNDTMVEPTDNGWRLLGFVRQFWEKASGQDLDRVEEIPF